MALLYWGGIDRNAAAPRDLVENMRKVGALVEILGLALERPGDEYDEDTAVELVREAGSLLERLGVRAMELLEAQGAPPAPARALKPRERRTPKRRAA
ncbi:MAG: hypothetical protein HYY95_27585 [Candidatus Rokubacteria bacterium]|nr:hypothetical protein [Candidatus Rokubacteria bacterium]MBI3109291.1 hypothetical protein [Candidatus Rokubacteria bacterium]